MTFNENDVKRVSNLWHVGRTCQSTVLRTELCPSCKFHSRSHKEKKQTNTTELKLSITHSEIPPFTSSLLKVNCSFKFMLLAQ
jgi:hypothetical protein